MRSVYYSVMSKVAVLLLAFAAAWTSAATFLRAQQPPLKTASLESHEGLTVSVRPWTDAAQYKEKFHKNSPLAAGIVALEVAFRNDSDDSIRINLSRIRLNVDLSDDNRQGLATLTPDEVADGVLHPVSKDPTTSRSKLPIPIGKQPNGHDKRWTELQKAASDAGLPGSIVAPHKTLEGLLYFDLQGQLDLLNAAHFYVPEAMALESHRPLMYFDVDLSKRNR